MKLRIKLLLTLALAGALPVGLLGWLSWRVNHTELARAGERLVAERAGDLARAAGAETLRGVEGLQLAAGYLPFEGLEREELAAVLRLPLRQLRSLSLLALVDARGDALAPPAVAAGADGRPALDEEGLKLFSRNVPLSSALSTGAAIGVPYRGAGLPRVAIAVRVSGDPARLLVGELVLSGLHERAGQLGLAGELALVADGRGEPIERDGGAATAEAERALLREGLAAGAPLVRTLEGEDGVSWLAAFAPVTDLGWGALVARRQSEALAPAQAVLRYTAFWTVAALLVSLSLGSVLARGVTAPVRRLSQAARAIAGGDYGSSVPAETSDEIGELAEAFNAMGEQVRRRDAEIRSWNETLQQRVDEKSRELREAQSQIERSRRLAALGSLSAGFAHELNSPLTGVMGLASLLKGQLRDQPEAAEMAEMLLEQSKRMASVVAQLREVVDEQRAGSGVRFDPVRPVRAALEESRPALEARGVALACQLAEGLPQIEGNPDQIRQVLGQLLQNALTAMPSGGSLTVHAGLVGGGAVRLAVQDTGRGIPEKNLERIFDPFFTTKDEPGRVGLGLTVASRIVEAHHGRILVESRVGEGTTVAVVLPAAGEAPHLV